MHASYGCVMLVFASQARTGLKQSPVEISYWGRNLQINAKRGYCVLLRRVCLLAKIIYL